MGRNNYFQFKKFKIIQEMSAMKVGTDGILLGVWADVFGAKNILDVGTGTGLIALMLAQRSYANVTGVEIEKGASYEAAQNVKNSAWSGRIEIKNVSFQEFVKTSKQKFDSIVSNPPFFENDKKSENRERLLARHTDLLPFEDLVKGAAKLLKKEGRFSVILPAQQAADFIKIAAVNGLFASRLTQVNPIEGKAANRWLVEFKTNETVLKKDCLIVYEKHGKYTPEFIDLTRDFYLSF